MAKKYKEVQRKVAPKESEHIRYNCEEAETPERALHNIIIVSEKDPIGIRDQIYAGINTCGWGTINIQQESQGQVRNSRYKYTFTSFESTAGAKSAIETISNLGINIVQDPRLKRNHCLGTKLSMPDAVASYYSK